MEMSDSIWQWGNARKTMVPISSAAAPGGGSCAVFNKISSVAGGCCSVDDKTSSGALGFSSKNNLEEGLLNARQMQFMDAADGHASLRRSQRISEANASKRDLALPVQTSPMEVNLCKSVEDLIEANSIKSPISIIQAHVSLSDTANSDAISCPPHGDWSPELDSEDLVRDRVFCEKKKKKPCKLRVRRRDPKGAHEEKCLVSNEGIHSSSFRHIDGEISMEASSSCSISKEVQLQQPWGKRSSRPVGASESTSTYMDWSCKRPKREESLILKGSFENQKEISEVLFTGLHLLADIAEEEEKASSEAWVKAIFPPTGLPFWQKRVIRRAKSAFKSVSSDTEKQTPENPQPLLTSNAIGILGSHGCLEASNNQVMDDCGVDKDQRAIPGVRCSKRTRSQFLNSKYCDSVLQPWKRGTRR